jgi:protein TonB
MPYATTEGNRGATIAAVGALHAAAIYALVTGLAGPIGKIFVDPPLVATRIPLPQPPPSVPDQRAKDPIQKIPQTDRGKIEQVFTLPNTAINDDSDKLILPPLGGGELGGGVLEPPVPPLPPQPPVTFAPKDATPRGAPGRWVTPNDYPAADLRAEREGITSFRLSIDSVGKVLRCEILKSSGSTSLDDAACAKLSSRARFNAATDASGAQAAGTYSGNVRWKLPKDY